MAVHCPECSGTDTNLLADKIQCLSCGAAFVHPPVSILDKKKGK